MSLAMMLIIALASLALVSGHGKMDSPQPRAGTSVAGNNKGNNRGPCGRGAALNTQGTPVANYIAGQTVDVQIRTTIRHGGTCRISLIEQGAGTPTAIDSQGRLDATVNGVYDLTGDFPCCQANGVETKAITIPATASCTNCILQWFWDGDSNYYNCADVNIQAAIAPTPAPTPVLTPAPTPQPTLAPSNPMPNPVPNPVTNPSVPSPPPYPAYPSVPSPNPSPKTGSTIDCQEADEIAGLCTSGRVPSPSSGNQQATPQLGRPYGGSIGMVAGAHWSRNSAALLLSAMIFACH